jgi:hypothetical protein
MRYPSGVLREIAFTEVGIIIGKRGGKIEEFPSFFKSQTRSSLFQKMIAPSGYENTRHDRRGEVRAGIRQVAREGLT